MSFVSLNNYLSGGEKFNRFLLRVYVAYYAAPIHSAQPQRLFRNVDGYKLYYGWVSWSYTASKSIKNNPTYHNPERSTWLATKNLTKNENIFFISHIVMAGFKEKLLNKFLLM